MDLSSLITKVQDAVEDTSVSTPTAVTNWINDGIREVTFRVDFSSLRTNSSVATVLSQAYTSLPPNYQRDLYFLVNTTTGIRIKNIYKSLADILAYYPLLDQVGDVVMAAIDEGVLYYQAVPETAQNLQLYYYRNPATLVADDDVPEAIPSHLHEDTLVPYAAYRGWDLIEQAMNEKKTNSESFHARYEIAILKIRNAVTPKGGDFSA
jgi:hypothetical protein